MSNYNTREPMAIFSGFTINKEHVNYHDSQYLNAVCGCSSPSCIEKRIEKTQKNEVSKVVKKIGGIITFVPNDIVVEYAG